MKAQRGVAIVLAMGVVALAALAATAMLVSQSTWARHVELTAGHVQAQLLIRAGLDWTRAVLDDDRRAGNVDHLGEPWALRLPPVPVESGSLAGYIEDQQGRFNLNNLLKNGQPNLAQLAQFRRLLSILVLPPTLADALVQWMNAGSGAPVQDQAEGASDSSSRPPSPVTVTPLTDVAELVLVPGFDHDVRARLRPFIAALPGFTAVNVNTAPSEVLAATFDGLHLDDARTLVAQRERAYFRDIPEFLEQLPPGLIAANDNISVSSDYFIATMVATIDGAQAHGSALLTREKAGWPAIIWRKYP